MKRIIWSLPILLASNFVYAGPGENIAKKINDRYLSSVSDCGGQNQGAYKCSGVIFRAYDANDEDQWPWTAPTDDSMSFSYLRADITNSVFINLNYGTIVIPEIEIQSPIQNLNYRCAFPVNGYTNARDDNGCGQYDYIEGTQQCQSQGIFTGPYWYSIYANTDYVCGFDLTNQWDNSSADAFMAMLDASRFYMQSYFMSLNNEIIADPWSNNPEQMANLPIEAFFIKKEKDGDFDYKAIRKAQQSQEIYYRDTIKWIPIITMIESDAPKNVSLNGKIYTFNYDPEIQAVTPPHVDR
ncbi:TPA: hypothetical protein ACX6RT_003728 [Photobacterium damselae]